MNMINRLKRIFDFVPPNPETSFIVKPPEQNVDFDIRKEKQPSPAPLISDDIEENLAYIRKRFSVPLNNDFVIRNISMKNNRRAFLVFIEGMVNTDYVSSNVIQTMQKLPYFADDEVYKYEDEIAERFISHSSAVLTNSMDKVSEEVNFGSCAVFVDGFKKAVVLDVKSWGTRSIDRPQNEQSIYGPQEAFGEILRTNTVLIRKIIKTENLIAQGVTIGTVSKTKGVLLYINDIADRNIVREALRRINGITMDYVISIEEIEMMIEEDTFAFTTQILETERPDRAARALTEGKVALLLNGSSKALIFPTTIFELNQAVSDSYMRVPYANMTRIIRMITVFSSLLLPGIYLATTLYHQEVIPTYLLYSISASRENVPFPSALELILMDISFEMIREAGIRMPGAIGSTLGIVGGLILGQAAVSAKIVSPIMIIVIAITGIGSFAAAEYSIGWSYRILRLVFILLGSTMGFYGIAAGIVLYALMLGARKSFGVPFIAPLPKVGNKGVENSVFVNPIWRREKRPSYLNTKNKSSEPKISRIWRKK